METARSDIQQYCNKILHTCSDLEFQSSCSECEREITVVFAFTNF